MRIVKREINCQTVRQEKSDIKNTIKIGSINSAEDKPNQIALKDLPLLLEKYLDIAVVAVWDINPWPENLIKKIAITNKYTFEINEKKKVEKNSRKITTNE